MALAPRSGGRLAKSLVAVLVTLLSCTAFAEIKLLLRYDDYSSVSDARLETQLFDAATRHRTSVLVGVIPFVESDHPTPTANAPRPMSEQKRQLLAKYAGSGAVVIAVHGYNHRHQGDTDEHRLFEFAGLPRERQAELMVAGRAYLESITGHAVTAFIPPFSAYDRATLAAAKSAGLSLFSAGIDGVVSDTTLVYLPGTTHPHKLRSVVAQAVQRGIQDALVVVTAHPYDFTDSRSSLPEFRNAKGQISVTAFLEDLDAVVRMPGVRLVTAQDLVDEGEDLSAARTTANRRLIESLTSRFGPFLGVDGIPEGLLLTDADASYRYWSGTARWLFVLGCLYGALVVVGLRLNRWIAANMVPSAQWPLLMLIVGAVGLLLLRSATYGLYFWGMLSLCAALGLLSGILADALRRNQDLGT